MSRFIAATEAELARARQDPAYRRQLLSANLEQLVAELNRRKRSETAPARGPQLREGAELAVKLADLIARTTQKRG